MRLFVAAEPSDAVRGAAVAAMERLRARLEAAGAGSGIRWVPPPNLHLTVWFLGEVSDARTAAVLEALTPPLRVPAFSLHLRGFGAFPPAGAPRVLWMGVASGLPELAQAHDEIGARLQPWGFPPEGRAYSAHLTIARIKDPSTRSARSGLDPSTRSARSGLDPSTRSARSGLDPSTRSARSGLDPSTRSARSGLDPSTRSARSGQAATGRGHTTIRAVLKELSADAGACRVEALTVFRSRTSPRGAEYEPLLRVPLS
ncbi:MAG TPA: RNA 2',3'-cyclic phosphodiesterase [Vicinamibacterales bacterium]|nr:RNA 2',3'-cyclic phosphodiesterase [Vicinamibacterales bacterium]